MRVTYALAAIALVAPSICFAAAVPHAKCPNCTPAQMTTKALQMTPNISIGTSTIHVYSLATNVIKQFEVSCSGSQNAVGTTDGSSFASSRGGGETNATCPSQRIAIETPPNPTVKAQFDVLRGVYVETGGTMKAYYEVQSGWIPGITQGGTAYEILNSPTQRALLQDNLTPTLVNMSSISNTMQALVSAFNGFIGFSEGIIITVQITFPDGSKLEFRLRQGEDRFEYVDGSARTQGGQLIPDDPSDVNGGSWTDPGPYGTGDDLRRMVDRLQRMGIPVYRGGMPVGTTSVGPVRAIECEMVAGNLVCTITQPT